MVISWRKASSPDWNMGGLNGDAEISTQEFPQKIIESVGMISCSSFIAMNRMMVYVRCSSMTILEDCSSGVEKLSPVSRTRNCIMVPAKRSVLPPPCRQLPQAPTTLNITTPPTSRRTLIDCLESQSSIARALVLPLNEQYPPSSN